MSIKVTVDDIINALASDGVSVSAAYAEKLLEALDMDGIKQAASYATDKEERQEYIYTEICAVYWAVQREKFKKH